MQLTSLLLLSLAHYGALGAPVGAMESSVAQGGLNIPSLGAPRTFDLFYPELPTLRTSKETTTAVPVIHLQENDKVVTMDKATSDAYLEMFPQDLLDSNKKIRPIDVRIIEHDGFIDYEIEFVELSEEEDDEYDDEFVSVTDKGNHNSSDQTTSDLTNAEVTTQKIATTLPASASKVLTAVTFVDLIKSARRKYRQKVSREKQKKRVTTKYQGSSPVSSKVTKSSSSLETEEALRRSITRKQSSKTLYEKHKSLDEKPRTNLQIRNRVRNENKVIIRNLMKTRKRVSQRLSDVIPIKKFKVANRFTKPGRSSTFRPVELTQPTPISYPNTKNEKEMENQHIKNNVKILTGGKMIKVRTLKAPMKMPSYPELQTSKNQPLFEDHTISTSMPPYQDSPKATHIPAYIGSHIIPNTLTYQELKTSSTKPSLQESLISTSIPTYMQSTNFPSHQKSHRSSSLPSSHKSTTTSFQSSFPQSPTSTNIISYTYTPTSSIFPSKSHSSVSSMISSYPHTTMSTILSSYQKSMLIKSSHEVTTSETSIMDESEINAMDFLKNPSDETSNSTSMEVITNITVQSTSENHPTISLIKGQQIKEPTEKPISQPTTIRIEEQPRSFSSYEKSSPSTLMMSYLELTTSDPSNKETETTTKQPISRTATTSSIIEEQFPSTSMMSYQELMTSDPTIDRTTSQLEIKETTDQPNSRTTTILTPPSTSMMSYQELMTSDPSIDRTASQLEIKDTTDQPNSQTTTILTPPSTSMMSDQEQTTLNPSTFDSISKKEFKLTTEQNFSEITTLASLIEEHAPSLSSSEKSPPSTSMMSFQELTTSDQSTIKSISEEEIQVTTGQPFSETTTNLSLTEVQIASLVSYENSSPSTSMMSYQDLTTSDRSSDKSHSDKEIKETTSQQLSLVEELKRQLITISYSLTKSYSEINSTQNTTNDELEDLQFSESIVVPDLHTSEEATIAINESSKNGSKATQSVEVTETPDNIQLLSDAFANSDNKRDRETTLSIRPEETTVASQTERSPKRIISDGSLSQLVEDLKASKTVPPSEVIKGQYHEINPGQYHEANPGQYHETNPGQYHETNPGQYDEINPGQDLGVENVTVDFDHGDESRNYNVQANAGDFIIGEVGQIDINSGQTFQGVRYTAVEGEVDQAQISDILEKYFGARTS